HQGGRRIVVERRDPENVHAATLELRAIARRIDRGCGALDPVARAAVAELPVERVLCDATDEPHGHSDLVEAPCEQYPRVHVGEDGCEPHPATLVWRQDRGCHETGHHEEHAERPEDARRDLVSAPPADGAEDGERTTDGEPEFAKLC